MIASNLNFNQAIRNNSPMFSQHGPTNNSHYKQKTRAVKQNLVEIASDKVSYSTEAASNIRN